MLGAATTYTTLLSPSLAALLPALAQAARIGWTVGITMDDLVGAQCGAVAPLESGGDAGARLAQTPERGDGGRVAAA